MSYSLYLIDPVTNECETVPGHYMIGGIYLADYHSETNTFTKTLNTEAYLNITYNYGPYYREVYDYGINCINQKQAADSIPILEHMIYCLEEKYKVDGEWIITKRLGKRVAVSNEKESERYEGPQSNYWTPSAANAIRPLYQLLALAKMRLDCYWEIV